MAEPDSRTIFPAEHLSGLALHESPLGNCSKVPTPVAGSALVRTESRRHLGSSHLICPSACPASFSLVTQPGCTPSVAFSSQQFPREIVSQPLPSTFDQTVHVSCWGLVCTVTQQPLPWQGEMLLPFVCILFLLPIPFRTLTWKCRVGRVPLLFAIYPAPITVLGTQKGLSKCLSHGSESVA